MQTCIFCQIVAGESPASVFYEDDTVLGLMTIGPVTTGHAMVIPKQHAAYLADIYGRSPSALPRRVVSQVCDVKGSTSFSRMVKLRSRTYFMSTCKCFLAMKATHSSWSPIGM